MALRPGGCQSACSPPAWSRCHRTDTPCSKDCRRGRFCSVPCFLRPISAPHLRSRRETTAPTHPLYSPDHRRSSRTSRCKTGKAVLLHARPPCVVTACRSQGAARACASTRRAEEWLCLRPARRMLSIVVRENHEQRLCPRLFAMLLRRQTFARSKFPTT